MRSMAKSKDVSRLCSTVPVPNALQGQSRSGLVPILLDAPAAAAVLSISERAFHALRKRSDFPEDATVVLGARCVRFRFEALHIFARRLAAVANLEAVRPPRRRAGRHGENLRGEVEIAQGAPAGSGASDPFETIPSNE